MVRFFTCLSRILLFLTALLSPMFPSCAKAYAVLTHEAIIDAVWATNIRPLLLKRFPNVTSEELRGAHAYAYGGAIVQDMGYYPHGSIFFSDLTHYIRSGDFIEALIDDSQNLNEYAFALGALAHYAADNSGHRLATNLAVPLLYPKLRNKYGDTVTYEDDPIAHAKTEFGFDVIEVAKQRYAPDSYHDFIGFEVAQPLLDRAFEETYGLELKTVLQDEPRAISSYRHAVSSLIPRATRVAWSLKQDEIKKDLPGMTRRKFLYNLSRASYEKQWGKDYRKPSFGDTCLAFLYRLTPKIGPLKVLTFRTPTPQTEKLYEDSFNVTLDHYRGLLTAVGAGDLTLPNDNFDVGEMTVRGKYRLSDRAYEQLLDKLAKQDFAGTSSELQTQLLSFFADPATSPSMKPGSKGRAKLLDEVERLKRWVPAAVASQIRP